MDTPNGRTARRKNDDVFKTYRRGYKKRFGWIKDGDTSLQEFFPWLMVKGTILTMNNSFMALLSGYVSRKRFAHEKSSKVRG